MSRTPGSSKEASHERIVQTAARAIRKHGYAGVSVAEIMKQAGLTHGGFYAHFASREAMLEEALDLAASEGMTRMLRAAGAAGDRDPLHAMVAAYLSDTHVEHPERGCPLAALAGETARATPELRKVAGRNVGALHKLIESQFGDDDREGKRDRALNLLSSMVGALILARVVDDPELSSEIRDAVVRSAAAAD